MAKWEISKLKRRLMVGCLLSYAASDSTLKQLPTNTGFITVYFTRNILLFVVLEIFWNLGNNLLVESYFSISREETNCKCRVRQL